MIVLFVLVNLAALWAVANLAGWYVAFGREGSPLNWRFLGGPIVYMNWLDGAQPEWWRNR